MSFAPFATMQRALWWFLCLLVVLPTTLRGAPQGFALDFDGVDDSVEVTLPGSQSLGPPYTIAAWVYLRSGSTLFGKRTAVLSTPGCGGGVELLIRSQTENPDDPQFLELGFCGSFDGARSTLPVPLRTWTHVAVTVTPEKFVSYFINGEPAGNSFALASLSIGGTIRLGNNNEFRRFDGRLDEVMILSEALDPATIKGAYNNNFKGTEFPFMQAVFSFDEGTGSQLSDGAPAGGLTHGTLLGGPVWVRSGPTPPAVVRYEGTQQDFGGAWRTPSSTKSRDVDGDQIFGTDGYQFVNRAPAKPFYLASMEAVTGSYAGNEAYAFIDDPENPGTTFMTGTQNPAPGSGQSADVFRFTLNAHAVGRLIRVGVMIDHLDNAAYNPASLRLVQITGGGVPIPSVETSGALYRNRTPDWLFFDITGGQTGDTFVVRGLGGPNGEVTVGGVVFDSLGPIGGRIRMAEGATPSPYPSRIHIGGLGGDIGKLTLKLNGIRAGSPGLGVLLVGPGGQKVRPMVSAGAGFNVRDGATLTLDDFAAEDLPTPLEGPIPSGTYRPQSDQGLAGDLPTPAPAGPYPGALVKALDGPLNGFWSLYLSGFSGLIESWSLDFIPAPPPTVAGMRVS
ncbi:MAG: LamG domain-containing protein, partial [Verrucomicrobiales bacterium]|nr:LamG domain-containing protein [Verrucomicrobiales bacterium]